MRRLVRALVREPLVHFAVLGGVLVAVAGPPRGPEARREIVVPAEVVEALVAAHERRLGTPPTAAEREALVQEWIDDEVLYREALALGLDEGDSIVRRRLRQKMEFLIADLEPLADPDDAELQRYMRRHAERYRREDRVSFLHVFARSGAAGDHPPPALAGWMQSLRAGAEPSSLGDPFPLGTEVRAAPLSRVAARFGADFARALRELPVGSWQGPIRSAYGWHAVRVTGRESGGLPRLEAVRNRVLGDWRSEKRGQQFRAALRRLRARYAVRVERPARAAQVALSGAER